MSALTCSMRFAIPYPCCGPRTSSVRSTISASVPCQTSRFSRIPVLWETHKRLPHLLWDSNKNVCGQRGIDREPRRLRTCNRLALRQLLRDREDGSPVWTTFATGSSVTPRDRFDSPLIHQLSLCSH